MNLTWCVRYGCAQCTNARAQAHIVVLHWQIGAETLMQQQQQQQIMLPKRLFTIDFLVKHAHYTRSECGSPLVVFMNCNMQISLRLQRQQLAYFLFCFVNAVAAAVVIIIIIFG